MLHFRFKSIDIHKLDNCYLFYSQPEYSFNPLLDFTVVCYSVITYYPVIGYSVIAYPVVFYLVITYPVIGYLVDGPLAGVTTGYVEEVTRIYM